MLKRLSSASSRDFYPPCTRWRDGDAMPMPWRVARAGGKKKAGATKPVVALEDQYLLSGLRQISRGCQTIVTRADNDHVVLASHPASLPVPSWLFLLIDQIFELHHFAACNGGLWSSVLRLRWKLEDTGLLSRFE